MSNFRQKWPGVRVFALAFPGAPSRTILLLFLTCFLGVVTDQASAQSALEKPFGEIILRIRGQSIATNEPGAAAFDRKLLSRFKTHRIATSTPWTEGVPEFEGVLVRDVLKHIGAGPAKSVRAHSLNDYEVDIEPEDFDRFDVILAFRMNGQELTARDKGPLWIVYPRDSDPVLQDQRYDQRWAWQLDRLDVQ